MQQKDYKTVKKLFLCIMCCLEPLFKYASLATLGNIFKEFQLIQKLLNTLLVQLQNHLFKTLYIKTLQNKIQSINIIHCM